MSWFLLLLTLVFHLLSCFRIKCVLHVIIEAHLVWIDEPCPGVVLLELTSFPLFFVDATESVFVRVGDFLLGLSMNLHDFSNIAIGCWRSHLESAQDLVRTVYHSLTVSASVEFLPFNWCMLPCGRVVPLQVVFAVNKVESRGEKGIARVRDVNQFIFDHSVQLFEGSAPIPFLCRLCLQVKTELVLPVVVMG